MQMNRHKGMIIVKIWLSPQEIIDLQTSLNLQLPNSTYDIIRKANERRDITWGK